MNLKGYLERSLDSQQKREPKHVEQDMLPWLLIVFMLLSLFFLGCVMLTSFALRRLLCLLWHCMCRSSNEF